jgi:hypothetical protein
MSSTSLPSFDEVRRRFADGHYSASTPRPDEKARVLGYLRELGAVVQTANDVLSAIRSMDDEEELAAVQCRDGVAVSHASDGWLLLFRDGDVGCEAQPTPGCGSGTQMRGDGQC